MLNEGLVLTHRPFFSAIGPLAQMQITLRVSSFAPRQYSSKLGTALGLASVRTQWGNMAAVYRQFNQTLKKGFEGLNGKMNDYNAFIQANTNVVKVYVPKSVRLNGGSVLAPYQITRGSLPSVAMVKAGDVLVSDIALGALVIDAATTVADLANAVIAYNDGWEAGDQVTFFYGQQTTDAVTGIPRARIYGFKVMLNPGDSSVLWEVVSELGFSSVGGKLGMSAAISDGAAVWIHSREDGTSGLKVSTQFLYVDSSVLAAYQGDSAMAASANSYGGINKSAVYLNPRSGSGGTGSVVITPAGGGSGSAGGSGSGETGGSQTGGGSEQGGSGGGQQTVSVSAPVFAGETQFEESTQVSMSAEAGATIHYTLDGSTPTASTGTVYSGPVTLTETTTVKAIAVKDGVSSSVTSRVYTKGGNGGGGGEGSGDME